MHVAKSPLRLTLAGGGTDLPSYYRKHGGMVLSAAIDKYVYVSIMRPFKYGVFLKYSQSESCTSFDEINHEYLKELCLTYINQDRPSIEITTLADIPSGTGLGSSGAFTSAAIKAIYSFNREYISNFDIAEKACHLEIERLGKSCGKQDQFASAIGGLNKYIFHKNDEVTIEKLDISEERLQQLQESLMLFFTGYSRNSEDILSHQKSAQVRSDKKFMADMGYVQEMSEVAVNLLEKGDFKQYGLSLHDHWVRKRKRSPGMSSGEIDAIYDGALQNGALGGKLVGAGGGGFLLFFATDKDQLRRYMHKQGLHEMLFTFEHHGVQVLEY